MHQPTSRRFIQILAAGALLVGASFFGNAQIQAATPTPASGGAGAPTQAAGTPATGSPSQSPDDRARALLGQMTLAQKIDMLHGELNNYYGFYNAPIPQLHIPALTMADGPAL